MVNLLRVILAGALLVSVPVAVSAQTAPKTGATTQQLAQTKEDTAKKNKEDCEKKGKGPGECGGG